jgi:hypothetical protein
MPNDPSSRVILRDGYYRLSLDDGRSKRALFIAAWDRASCPIADKGKTETIEQYAARLFAREPDAERVAYFSVRGPLLAFESRLRDRWQWFDATGLGIEIEAL